MACHSNDMSDTQINKHHVNHIRITNLLVFIGSGHGLVALGNNPLHKMVLDFLLFIVPPWYHFRVSLIWTLFVYHSTLTQFPC